MFKQTSGNGKTAGVSILYVCLLLMGIASGCVSEPKNTAPAVNTPVVRPGPLYTGEGGKNTRIAVLQPQAEDLPQEQQWISTYIQGVLTSDFNKYTAMTVIDRQNMDKLIDNQDFSASGYFSDDDYISIGNMLNAEYILIGSLRKIPQDGSFMLDLSVTHAATGQRIASFMPSSCNFNDIQNTSIIQRAFEDLASQLGVNLTEYGKQILHATINTEIAAETSLSKGIVAQKNQRIGEALAYYYNAASFSPAMPEVKGRISALSSSVSSGSLGENVRNLIAWRNSWNNVLKECDNFLENHIPFELIYDPASLKQEGKINYESETVNLSFFLMTKPSDGFKMIDDVLKGLKKTGKQEEWGFISWPYIHDEYVLDNKVVDTAIRVWREKDVYGHYTYMELPEFRDILVSFALINQNGETISTINNRVYCKMGSSIFKEDQGRWRGTSRLYPKEVLVAPESLEYKVVFENVDANKITDTLTIRILSIDNIDTETAAINGYIKISQGNI